MWNRRHPNLAKGAVAGLGGGLIASFLMNKFQAALSKLKDREEESRRMETAGRHGAQHLKAQDSAEEPATIKTATAVSQTVLDRDLRPEEKQPAGNAVHYFFGAASGALYGAVAEILPVARTGLGTLFGSVLWVGADVVAVPGLGLSKPARDYPASTHAAAWASHLVYGLTTELVRRGIRSR